MGKMAKKVADVPWFYLSNLRRFFGCVSLRKSKIGSLNPKESENGLCVSLLDRSIQDLSDHGASKETKNPLWKWILTHHDPRDLESISVVKKRKIRFRILSDSGFSLRNAALDCETLWPVTRVNSSSQADFYKTLPPNQGHSEVSLKLLFTCVMHNVNE